MHSGRLKNRITIQKYDSETRDNSGDISPAWVDYATVWAEVIQLSGREYWAAKQVNAEVETRVTIRYRSDVTPKMRVVFGARVLEIESVIDVSGRRDELQLMCREMV